MSDVIDSPYLVPFDESFALAEAATAPASSPSKKEYRKRLGELRDELDDLQRVLYAHDHDSVLLVFQAMDAAGKDGTIRAVMSGVNPAGCQVSSFKQPSSRELDHDFLWRTTKRLPERGRIGVFNRSYYEEVLVVRVHPEYLVGQRLPGLDRDPEALERLWQERFESIREHEKHLARNGTRIIKFWLNVSRDEQKARFMSRLDEPEKNWKFSESDVSERGHWASYMDAYQEALRATSRPWAPWYAIPADNKRFMRLTVADIIVRTLHELELNYPSVSEKTLGRFDEMRALLAGEEPG